jgi:hypothetical protein
LILHLGMSYPTRAGAETSVPSARFAVNRAARQAIRETAGSARAAVIAGRLPFASRAADPSPFGRGSCASARVPRIGYALCASWIGNKAWHSAVLDRALEPCQAELTCVEKTRRQDPRNSPLATAASADQHTSRERPITGVTGCRSCLRASNRSASTVVSEVPKRAQATSERGDRADGLIAARPRGAGRGEIAHTNHNRSDQLPGVGHPTDA